MIRSLSMMMRGKPKRRKTKAPEFSGAFVLDKKMLVFMTESNSSFG